MLAAFALCALLSHVLASCPNGWTRYNDSCYRFKDQKVTWHNAKVYCHDIGGHLARIESREENNFLEQALRERHFLDNKDNYAYWIDGNDIAVEGDWKWEGNDSIKFFDWAPGEPNSSAGEEDCIQLMGYEQFHWNDKKCTYTCEFICEIEDDAEIIGR